MSFFSELKRRNVIRAGLAYIVAAWLLLQIADVLTQLLGLPITVGRVVVVVAALGFIPALVFAWAFEITPEGLKRDRELRPEDSTVQHTARKLDTITIAMLIAVGALVLVDRYLPRNEPAQPPPAAEAASAPATSPTAEAASAPAAEESPSVAVLPFANLSPDPDNEYFADGISEELLNLLVRVQGLRVPSRTSSFAFKGQNRDIREIAGELRVNHVLEGSVRKAGDRVRITAQLIDVSTDTHLWSETYDRELQDIFAVQDEIAGHIVDALKLVLNTGAAEQRPTDNLQAYTLYLQGRYRFQQREEHLREAEQLLRQAVELDPGFAEAWGALAMTYIVFPNYLRTDRAQAYAMATDAANHALALEPDLPQAKLAVAQVKETAGQLEAALDLYQNVVQASPQLSIARLWYGISLLNAGYANEALDQMAVAVDLDPTYGLMLDWYARTLLAAGHPEQVVEPAMRALKLGRTQARVALGQLYSASDDEEGLRRLFAEVPGIDFTYPHLIFEVKAHPERLQEALATVSAPGALDPQQVEYARLTLLLNAGAPAAFFEQMARVKAFDASIWTIVWIPNSARHRRDPAMKTWVRESGLLDLWRSRGWPDFCHPLGDEDFECE